jgi:hypothetical protein
MYGAASLKKRSIFSRSTLSGHSKLITLSKTTAVEQLLTLPTTSSYSLFPPLHTPTEIFLQAVPV